MKIYGLLDCNNFYASCERVFAPDLRDKPLVVLSNNDGCIIARSNEAKSLGLKMGAAVFKSKHILEGHQVIKRSGNFALYADLSDRVMSVLNQEIPDIEVYSIDEAFFCFGDSSNISAQEIYLKAQQVVSKVERCTGIPVSIGIATTKVLAKLANHLAKKNRCGVFSLYYDPEDERKNALIDNYLCQTDVYDLWGIGNQLGHFLHRNAIYTALDLKYANARWIKKYTKVNGARIQKELSGIACFPLQSSHNRNSKSILTSRSFGTRIKSLEELEAALANFVATAAQKLRKKNLHTRNIIVFIRGVDQDKPDFDYNKDWHGKSISHEISLVSSSNYTPELIKAAKQALKKIYQPGFYYKKAGVLFTNLSDASSLQLNFGDRTDHAKQKQINTLVDSINKDLGINSLYWMSMEKTTWLPNKSFSSPNYTTSWNDLAIIR